MTSDWLKWGKRLGYPFSTIARRIKQDMEMFWMTIGTIAFPLGFVLLFEAKGIIDNIMAVIVVAFAIFALVKAYNKVRYREFKWQQDKEMEDKNREEQIQNLINELTKFRQDFNNRTTLDNRNKKQGD